MPASLRAVLLLLSAISPALAAPLVYDESAEGELSADHFAPTLLRLKPGTNLLTGAMGPPTPGAAIDRDIWMFTIQPGYRLTAIPQLFRQPLENSFVAIQAGSSIDPSQPQFHLSNALIGLGEDDVLAALDAGPEFGGVGFDGPLGPGTYTMWFQEITSRVNYTFAFQVDPVPEPGTASLALAGGLALLWPRRRREVRRGASSQ